MTLELFLLIVAAVLLGLGALAIPVWRLDLMMTAACLIVLALLVIPGVRAL